MTLRRVALREAEHLAASGHHQTLPPRERDRLYLEVDGHMCPTREPKHGPEDQGYREAKAVLAFSGYDVAEVSKERTKSCRDCTRRLPTVRRFVWLCRGLSPRWW